MCGCLSLVCLLWTYFLARGHPQDILEDAFIHALTKDRHSLLFSQPTATNTPTALPTLRTNHILSLYFPGTIQENWHLLGSPCTQQLYSTEITFRKLEIFVIT